MENEKFDLDAFRAQPLPTEEEVMANWQGDIEKPVVSILCHMFNQEMYIEDAFRGFLLQKTNFVFEVIAHDDASTDGTSDIVREYANRYPKIFKPVIQTENQYSKGAKPCLLSSPHAKGKYFALCEGDDFWVNENKLQQQFLTLQKHPEVKLCFTPALGLRNDGSIKEIANNGKEEKVISASKVIRGGGGFMPTASLFFNCNVISDVYKWINDAPVGDYYIQVFGAMDKGVIYIPISSCCYRLQALGSWSSSHNNINSFIKFRNKSNISLKKLSKAYRKYKYSFIYLLFKANFFALLVLLKKRNFRGFFKYLFYLTLGRI